MVVVTGGGKGIGKAYVEGFAREGASVVAADIDFEAAKEVEEELVGAGNTVMAQKMDVSDQSSVKQGMCESADRFGGIDILVNNASLMSVLPRGPWHEISVDDWDRVMAVNVRGVFLCCLEAFPYMEKAGQGKIVNISSSRIWEGEPNRLHYTTSKMAVVGFTRAIARELGKYGINVNAMTPGRTLSETQVATSDPEYLKRGLSRRSIQRVEVPEDLVGAVLFLSSSASDFITGQTINVDGGRSMH